MLLEYTSGHLWLDIMAAVGTVALVVAVVGVPAILLWPAEGSAYARSLTLRRPARHDAPAKAVKAPTTELERIRQQESGAA